MRQANFSLRSGMGVHPSGIGGSVSLLTFKPDAVALASRADEFALDGFLCSVERRAFRIAEMATRSRDDALDIVQDAMLQLARSYAQRPSDEWPPLFYRILENKIRDWQRRHAVRRRLFGGGFVDEAPDGEEQDLLATIADPACRDAVDGLKQGQAMAVLRKALPALPARQREAFELRVWEGLSVEETAQVMGCSDGSVKTHLSRALHTLRDKLAGVWP